MHVQQKTSIKIYSINPINTYDTDKFQPNVEQSETAKRRSNTDRQLNVISEAYDS